MEVAVVISRHDIVLDGKEVFVVDLHVVLKLRWVDECLGSGNCNVLSELQWQCCDGVQLLFSSVWKKMKFETSSKTMMKSVVSNFQRLKPDYEQVLKLTDK